MSTKNPITPEQRLSAIRERHGNATEGPWWFDESDTCWRLHGVMGRIPPLRRDGFIPEQVMNKQILKAAKQGTPYAEYWPDKADAAFIVGAWKDVRDLLAEVERLNAAVDLLGRELQKGSAEVMDALREAAAEMRADGVAALTEVSFAVARWRQGGLDANAALEVIEAAVVAPDDDVDDTSQGGEPRG